MPLSSTRHDFTPFDIPPSTSLRPGQGTVARAAISYSLTTLPSKSSYSTCTKSLNRSAAKLTLLQPAYLKLGSTSNSTVRTSFGPSPRYTWLLCQLGPTTHTALVDYTGNSTTTPSYDHTNIEPRWLPLHQLRSPLRPHHRLSVSEARARIA